MHGTGATQSKGRTPGSGKGGRAIPEWDDIRRVTSPEPGGSGRVLLHLPCQAEKPDTEVHKSVSAAQT